MHLLKSENLGTRRIYFISVVPMFFDFTTDFYVQNYSRKTEILPFYPNHTVCWIIIYFPLNI